MKRIFLMVLLYLFLFAAVSAFNLDALFFQAEGLYLNGKGVEALTIYQNILSLTDKSYLNHEKALRRTLQILSNQSGDSRSGMLKQFARRYVDLYPSGEGNLMAREILSSRSEKINESNYGLHTRKVPFRSKRKSIKTPENSLEKRFAKGSWVEYEIQGMPQMTSMLLAVNDMRKKGNKYHVSLYVRYENVSGRSESLYEVVFKTLHRYEVRSVKVRGTGQKQIERNDIQKLPFTFQNLDTILKTMRPTYIGMKKYSNNEIKVYEFKGSDSTLIFSPYIPIWNVGFLEAQAKGRAFRMSFNLKRFGHIGGNSFW